MQSTLKYLFLVLLLTLCSCAAFQNAFQKKAPEDETTGAIQRRVPTQAKVVSKVVSREIYKDRFLNGGNLNKVRLVEVFSRGAGAAAKEYRFFEIQPGSIYELLGFQDFDVLVAASGYVIPTQDTFWDYLKLLPSQREAAIELKRNGVPVVLRYRFIP